MTRHINIGGEVFAVKDDGGRLEWRMERVPVWVPSEQELAQAKIAARFIEQRIQERQEQRRREGWLRRLWRRRK